MKLRVVCGLLAIVALSGCDLGEGSKPVSVAIIPANGSTGDPTVSLTECFREQLALQVTFSDGQIGNATGRATWTSSDPGKVQVSNGDVNVMTVSGDKFLELTTLPFNRGVLIPKAVTATPVTVTANFLGLTASINVTVASATLTLVPRPVVSSASPAAPFFIGKNFSERFTVRFVKNGRLMDAGDFGRNDATFNSALNPVLWTIPGGTFVAANTADDVATDAATFLNNTNIFVPAGTAGTDDEARRANATATLTVDGGLVAGVNASTSTVPVQAQFSTCNTTVTTTASIAALVPANELTLSHEADFNGAGSTTGDLVTGTSELLRTVANLDTDLNGTADATQDVTALVDYEIIEADRDVCATNAATGITACASSILTFATPANYLTTVFGTDGSFDTRTVENPRVPGADPRFNGDTAVDAVKVRACFPRCTDNSADTPPTLASNPLDVRAVAAVLNSVAINPTTAAEPAFTAPAFQYKAYGAYTAGTTVDGVFTPAAANAQFIGGATASQNLGRYLTWVARPAGVTDTVSEIAGLFIGGTSGNNSIGGQVFYVCDPLTDTTLDITAGTNNTTIVSTAVSDAIAKVTFTVQHNPAVTDRTQNPACER